MTNCQSAAFTKMNRMQDTALDIALERGAGRTAAYLLSIGCTSYHYEDKSELQRFVNASRQRAEMEDDEKIDGRHLLEAKISDQGSSDAYFHFYTMDAKSDSTNQDAKDDKESKKFTPSAKKRMTAYKHNVAARKAAKEKGESHFNVEMYASEQDALKHTKAMEKSSMDIENTVAAMLRRIAAYRRNDETAQRYRGWYFRNGNIIQSNENQTVLKRIATSIDSILLFEETNDFFFLFGCIMTYIEVCL